MELKILSAPVDVSACGNYRIRKPLAGLEKYCGDTIHIYDNAEDSANDLVKSLPHFDYIFLRPGAELFMFKIKSIKELKIKALFVIDIDDNVDLISPYSQFYASYGTKEVMHDGKPLWKDGKDGFDTSKNLMTLNSLKMGLRSVDLVTTTTEKLAEHARKFNKNTYVNDNTINFDHWWRLNNKENSPLRVVWQGSPSHYADWYTIKVPLQRLMDEFDFELIMLGSNYTGIFKPEHLSRVRSLPWVPFDAHSYRMMSLQADIGIIPLADEPFNHYKSAIKWYENAAMGVPSVVSLVKPYSDSITDGVNALGYKTSNQFYDQMKKLLTDAKLRKDIAEKAYNWVKENKSLESESKKLHNYLENELERRQNG